MVPGDLCFVKGSFVIDGRTPMIFLEKYRTPGFLCDYYVILNPRTGERYEFQEHNLSEVPE